MVSDVLVEHAPAGPVLRPADQSGAVILYLPAGPEPDLGTATRLAELTGSTVLCCRYRSRFPDALRDVQDGYRHCQDARHRQDAGSVVVAGERMGAGLAAALLVQLRDSGAGLPRCAVLVSALLDLTMQAKSLRLHAGGDAPTKITELRRRIADYAGGAMLTDPYLSPLYANLHGLAPVRLVVAGTDPLLDDSLTFATRAARSGVEVDLRVRPDAVGFDTAAAIAELVADGPSYRPAGASVNG